MEKEFIPYEQALDLKELGFDEPCFGYRDGVGHLMIKSMPHSAISAPTFSQSFRWFREKHNILATIYSNASGYLFEWHDSIGGTHRGWSEYEGPNEGGVWDTYEEAELACLNKLIEIVKTK
jgi:hypothetical protein